MQTTKKHQRQTTNSNFYKNNKYDNNNEKNRMQNYKYE